MGIGDNAKIEKEFPEVKAAALMKDAINGYATQLAVAKTARGGLAVGAGALLIKGLFPIYGIYKAFNLPLSFGSYLIGWQLSWYGSLFGTLLLMCATIAALKYWV